MASILIVDDNDGSRETLVARLELLGHRVRGTRSVRQLRETLAQRPVQLVLVEIALKDDGARKLLAQRQDDASLSAIPFGVIAGPEDMQLAAECIELGADDYFWKPFDPVLFELRINTCLGRRRGTVGADATTAGQPQDVETRLRRFLSPQIAEAIASSADESLLQSHRREITVAFCDLRGFTPFSETAEPEDVMTVIREFHAAMGEIIFRYEGTLEHFEGDGMMVFFNDPVPMPDPAGQAVRMALAMQARAAELGRAWLDRGFELGMGMGIATGYATLGRIGFEGRFDYGAIGSVTNLAARLCAEAQAGQILVHRRVYSAVQKQVEAAPVGRLELKGVVRPVEAFNVVSAKAARA